LVGYWYSTLYINQHIQHSDDTIVTTFSLDDVTYESVCEFICVCLYNYEGGNVLYHILWHCFYKVKSMPYLEMCYSENSVVSSTPDVFLGIVVGGRRAIWIMFEFHLQVLLQSWIQLLWFLGYFTTCLDHLFILSSLISILIPVICFYTTHVSVTCFFLAFFNKKFNFMFYLNTYLNLKYTSEWPMPYTIVCVCWLDSKFSVHAKL